MLSGASCDFCIFSSRFASFFVRVRSLMSNIDDIKYMFTKGDKEGAIKILVSILQQNRNDIDAWLLLGEVICDPSKKRDCYNQVLKISPNNPLALNGLKNLEAPRVAPVENPAIFLQYTPPTHQIEANSEELIEETQDLQANFQHEPKLKTAESFKNMKEDWTIAGIVALSLVGFFGISYVLGLIFTSGNSSSDSDPLCTGMIFLSLIAGLFIWYSSKNNRSEIVNTAIQKQKQTSSSNSSKYSSSPHSNVVPCRVCQHTVSRMATSCPNCGELYPGLISKCPYCYSKNIGVTLKGFSLGKAAAGAVIAGPVGVTGGLHGRKDLEVKCSNCNRSFTIKSDEIR